MDTLSPVDTGGNLMSHPSNGSTFGSGESSGARSPLHMNLGFLKSLTEKKTTTRDGQPPKRRGPKPDSKPALTRRQELNRQAQRTHRERKEIYIKALEEQVMRLKENFTGTIQEKNAIAEENRKLKELLRIHGINDMSVDGNSNSGGAPSTYGGSVTESRAGSYNFNPSFTPPPSTFSGGGSPGMSQAVRAGGQQYLGGSPQQQQQQQQQQQRQHQQQNNNGLDHDQIGVDFVLALERPCMDHTQFMLVRSHQEPEPFVSGHALMATCPPSSHITNSPDVPYPHKMMDIPNSDLMSLLTLSQSLPLDGEFTPVMAWSYIRSHDRYNELTVADFEKLIEALTDKSRCYGFGAVLEEFEIRDALTSIFATKPEGYTPPSFF